MYHEGQRELQDRFDSRRIADRLEEITVHAELSDDDVALQAFPNCPRSIHRMELKELSVFAPGPGHHPPEPEWKAMEVFRDHLPGPWPA